jgi:hypothetical protein
MPVTAEVASRAEPYKAAQLAKENFTRPIIPQNVMTDSNQRVVILTEPSDQEAN